MAGVAELLPPHRLLGRLLRGAVLRPLHHRRHRLHQVSRGVELEANLREVWSFTVTPIPPSTIGQVWNFHFFDFFFLNSQFRRWTPPLLNMKD